MVQEYPAWCGIAQVEYWVLYNPVYTPTLYIPGCTSRCSLPAVSVPRCLGAGSVSVTGLWALTFDLPWVAGL